MSEATPAIIDLTVIWRPLFESDFRLDYVTCEAGCRRAALHAAADQYRLECDDPEIIIYDYELIAVLEGHVTEHVHV